MKTIEENSVKEGDTVNASDGKAQSVSFMEAIITKTVETVLLKDSKMHILHRKWASVTQVKPINLNAVDRLKLHSHGSGAYCRYAVSAGLTMASLAGREGILQDEVYAHCSERLHSINNFTSAMHEGNFPSYSAYYQYS